MLEQTNIGKNLYIVNQKNGYELALEFIDGDLQLNELDDKNSNQIWILERHPYCLTCYYIIHAKTNKALELSGTTTQIGDFAYQDLSVSDLIKGSHSQSWRIMEREPEKAYTIETSMENTEFKSLGSPKSDEKRLPQVLVSSSEQTNHAWILRKAPDEANVNLFEIFLNTPAYMIREMCKAIADAQRELDAAALETQRTLKNDCKELHDIGYQVTWYQIPEATMELKVAVHFERSGAKSKIFVSPFNASYQNQFKFTADGSSNIKLRVVPIPPPIGLGEKP
jgi:hypothetical protein